MDKYRAAKLLARHIEINGQKELPQFYLDPCPPSMATIASPCWLWTGAFRPRQPNALKTNPLGLINMPRPICTLEGRERNPVKPLMCLEAGVPFSEEPERIHRRCQDRRCVNPFHHSANVSQNSTIRNIFP